MTFQSKLTELNHYFYIDHKARFRTSLINLVVGSFVLLFCASQGFRHSVSLVLTTLAITVTCFSRLALYEAPVKEGRRNRRHVSITKLASGRNGYPSAATIQDRRRLLLELPIGIAAMAAVMALLPATSEAEAVHRRLLALVANGDIAEAEKVANEAVEARLELRPNVLGLLGKSVPVDKTGELVLPLDLASERPREPNNRAIVLVAKNHFLSIWLPTLYIPKGTYRMGGPLKPAWVSFVGDGLKETILGIDFTGTSKRPLLEFNAGMKVDVIFCGISVLSLRPSQGDRFIEIGSGVSEVAVVAAHLAGLVQKLDSIIWEHTTFQNCSIVCGGNRLVLSVVRFIDCAFTFSSGISQAVISSIQNSAGETVDIDWSPS